MFRKPAMAAILTIACTFSANSADWKPITDAELAMKAPRVDKDAPAEAIFWEVRVLDELAGDDLQTSRSHYLRMKVFNEKGRDYAKVELTYGKKSHISGVSGRTIKPDGRIVDMKKDAIFDTDAAKGKGLRLRARSFTLPDVEPGDIIEYQWKEVETGALSNYLRLPLQRDIPVETVRYFVKPFSSQYVNIAMRSMSFHVDNRKFQSAPQGYSMVEYTNMPAFKEEPDMVPEDDVRAWVLVFYADGGDRTPEKYWPEWGRKSHGAVREAMKINGDIKKIAAEESSAGDNDEAKIRAIYAWLKKNVRNVQSALVSAEERRAFKENKNSADTLRQRLGTGYDLNILFAALVSAAGFEATLAWTGDRSEQFFNPGLADSYFLRGELVAVKVGAAWKYYDPASTYLASGSQLWEQQGADALITDSKKPTWERVPLSRAADSLESRTARLKLDRDGTLDGHFSIRYTGHLAVEERRELIAKNDGERDQYLIDEMKSRFGSPEISGITWENVADPEKPLTVRFDMKIKGYVQHTGKRIFVQAGVFQFNFAPRFPASTRQHPIYFRYAWSESDDISLEVPEGFEFDHPDIPASIAAQNTVHWKVTASIDAGRTLHYRRDFMYGDDGNIVLPVSSYPALKTIFDKIHEGDEHTFALKQVQ